MVLREMVAGQGYQIKLNSDQQLTISGGDKRYCRRANSFIDLTLGWNSIGYLRQFPADVPNLPFSKKCFLMVVW